MKQSLTYLLLLLCSVSFARGFACVKDSVEWKKLVMEKYTLHYTSADKSLINKIDKDLQSGLNYIVGYFHHPFQNKFDVFIFPNRTLMDKQWQKDWGDSSFQSQCWMIASGFAHRLDILGQMHGRKKHAIIMQMIQQKSGKLYGMNWFMYFAVNIILIMHSVLSKN